MAQILLVREQKMSQATSQDNVGMGDKFYKSCGRKATGRVFDLICKAQIPVAQNLNLLFLVFHRILDFGRAGFLSSPFFLRPSEEGY
jgi:hypothetical protein